MPCDWSWTGPGSSARLVPILAQETLVLSARVQELTGSSTVVGLAYKLMDFRGHSQIEEVLAGIWATWVDLDLSFLSRGYTAPLNLGLHLSI